MTLFSCCFRFSLTTPKVEQIVKTRRVSNTDMLGTLGESRIAQCISDIETFKYLTWNYELVKSIYHL